MNSIATFLVVLLDDHRVRYNNLMNDALKKTAREIFFAALRSVDPSEAVLRHADGIIKGFRAGNYQRLFVLGFGKASCPMASALEDSLGDLVTGGIIITKYGHCSSRKPERMRFFEAGHPVPDAEGVRATAEAIDLVGNADEKTMVVCLISGGGSALLVAPCEGVSLEDKMQTTEVLLKAGADIVELNTVRKHISRVKGGRLAELVYPASVVSLILSDVLGDRLDAIASGPTAPDATTYAEALGVMDKYHLRLKAPEGVMRVLDQGAKGLLPETPKGDSSLFRNVRNIIIGANRIALDAARQKAEALGLRAEILSSELKGEARDVGRWLAQKANDIKKGSHAGERICIISGGETTVTVRGSGRGGRNMELALAFALEIEGIHGITFLSAGTDGTDGPTDAAGAIVDGETMQEARSRGMDPGAFLGRNDSYSFFQRTGNLFITGPTGTNVMDIQIVLIE
ncbi:MAG: glycerate kinase type-2 family protein [bacterium]